MQQNEVITRSPTDPQIQNPELLSCRDVCFFCKVPQFNRCQHCCGCVSAFLAGTGLECCCCYGCKKDDCCAVCLAGFSMNLLAPFVYGIVAGCVVGCKMINNKK